MRITGTAIALVLTGLAVTGCEVSGTATSASTTPPQPVELATPVQVRPVTEVALCPDPVPIEVGVTKDAAEPMRAKDSDGNCYSLAPTKLELTRLNSLGVEMSESGSGAVIELDMDSTDTPTWNALTAESVGKQLAFVVDGAVLSAPTVMGPISGSKTQIGGQFTRAEADEIVAALRGE